VFVLSQLDPKSQFDLRLLIYVYFLVFIASCFVVFRRWLPNSYYYIINKNYILPCVEMEN
jgi:hypothetical protein